MRVFRGIENLPEFKNPVFTTGTFDGVHTGHQVIIRRLNQLAANSNGENIILTFHPHPRMVLHKDDSNLKLLNTLEEKTSLLSKYGVDNLVVTPFSKEFSQLTAEQYVEDFIWKKFYPRKVVMGFNHRFGNNRTGDIELMTAMGKKLGFEVEEIEAQMVENISVSSTKIRNALTGGEIETANSLLGHPYTLTGKVVTGEHLGKKLGFPTANLKIEDADKLIPANGVYAVIVKVDETNFGGMLNIGFRPTFNGKKQTIEVHIFDFNEEVYGMNIGVDLVASIRKEMKFNSVDELIQQLKKDKEFSLKILRALKTNKESSF
ncbi:MAG: bifunctional riboflavin kinase/FAD synthetase [Chitinophagales bacterium]|nr:bifunctional riboflavin kinase/FAD synthetase [Chitinophagales bacterium]